MPPTAKPVAARASSGVARRASDAPATPASFEGSTRFAPDVNAITGRSSAMKISDFTICATSQPIAFAASAAVFVPSGNRGPWFDPEPVRGLRESLDRPHQDGRCPQPSSRALRASMARYCTIPRREPGPHHAARRRACGAPAARPDHPVLRPADVGAAERAAGLVEPRRGGAPRVARHGRRASRQGRPRRGARRVPGPPERQAVLRRGVQRVGGGTAIRAAHARRAGDVGQGGRRLPRVRRPPLGARTGRRDASPGSPARSRRATWSSPGWSSGGSTARTCEPPTGSVPSTSTGRSS